MAENEQGMSMTLEQFRSYIEAERPPVLGVQVKRRVRVKARGVVIVRQRVILQTRPADGGAALYR